MLHLAVNFLSKYVPGIPRTMYRLTGLTFPIPAAKLTPRLLIAAYRRRQLTKMLRRVELLKNLGEPEIEGCIDSLEMQKFKAGDVIFRQDDEGDPACCFVISGEAFATMQLHTFEVGLRVNHKRHGVGTVAEVTKEPNITKVVFDKGESHRYVPASLHKLKPVEAIEPRVEEVMQYRYGGHFGERALSRIEPRAATITCASAARGLPPTPEACLEPRAFFAAFFAFFAFFAASSAASLSSLLLRTLAPSLLSFSRSHRRSDTLARTLSPPLPPPLSLLPSLFLSLSLIVQAVLTSLCYV